MKSRCKYETKSNNNCVRIVRKSRSNENWNVYDAKAVCECGGKFKIMLREDAEKLRNEA